MSLTGAMKLLREDLTPSSIYVPEIPQAMMVIEMNVGCVPEWFDIQITSFRFQGTSRNRG